ncbi:MAG: mechanosensitive ion channel protein MscS [Pirellulaceae bacterium]|nr:MAG: mechanosensitive ion channel protein MscS [Pirellulaceae bacterium]
MFPSVRPLPCLALFLLLGIAIPVPAAMLGQDEASLPQDPPPASDDGDEVVAEVPEQVAVEPTARDDQIADRLTRILEATGWFEQVEVTVDEGVVFLDGVSQEGHHREWAGRLASNTQDVVAVVNRLRLGQQPLWDFTPAWKELSQLTRDLVRSLPLLAVGMVVLAFTWMATRWTAVGTRGFFQRRVGNSLLSSVLARTVAVVVFLLGLYLVLRISGLTRLAMTVIGGTGVLGLVVGFAFRDIAENFLASVLISMQQPFARGDLIAVADYKGFVQRVNTRSTLLMTLEGNHVQIPNATIYKETIINYMANPKTRFDFAVGIGYDDPINQAQSIALSVVREHPAVFDDPEPLVLVENLGASTVNLRVYFWVDIHRYDGLKVRSSVIRLTKLAYQQAGISMPDEAREVVFPEGVPVRMVPEEARAEVASTPPTELLASTVGPAEPVASAAEGDLQSDADTIKRQAEQSRTPEAGPDLLED